MTQTLAQALILQDLLKDDGLIWQVHNCKLSQQKIGTDTPLPFYVLYDTLDDDKKQAHPLSFELLKRLNEPMTTEQVANLLGATPSDFKKSYQIKYIASVVVFCETLQLALRFHISNTAKAMQAVFVAEQEKAWANECERWQAFGVVDVLYKGTHALYSHAQDEVVLPALPHYQTLPSPHSLSVLELINQKSAHLASIDKGIQDRLLAVI